MVRQRAQDRSLCIRSHCGLRFSGREPVELAHAGTVWLAHDHFLASAGPVFAMQDPLWRIPWQAGRKRELASSHVRALGTYVAGGAREASTEIKGLLHSV